MADVKPFYARVTMASGHVFLTRRTAFDFLYEAQLWASRMIESKEAQTIWAAVRKSYPDEDSRVGVRTELAYSPGRIVVLNPSHISHIEVSEEPWA